MSVRWLLLGCVACGAPSGPSTWEHGTVDSDPFRRGADTGDLDVVPTSDACPDDPNKDQPGFCGCDYADLDLEAPVGADTCVHQDALVDGTIGAGSTIEADVSVGSGAVIGAGATLREGAIIATRATVGADADIGAESIISRSAHVGARSVLGPDSVLSRASSVGEDVDASVGSFDLGYGASLGDRCTLTGTGVVIGSLSQIGADCSIGAGAVIGRQVILGDGAVIEGGAVIGPDVQAGIDLFVGANSRIRKEVGFGDGVTVGEDARVGRGSLLQDGVDIGQGAVLRANVQAGANAIVESDGYVPRNGILPERSLDPCDPAPGDTAPPPVVVDTPLTIGATDLSYECADLVVSSTLTVSGPHHFRSLTVENGGTVTHPAREVDGLLLTVSHLVDVRTGGAISANGLGGLGGRVGTNTGRGGETWSAAGPVPISANNNAGGSYGARGGGSSIAVYGDDVRNPVEFGTGGNASSSGGSSTRGGNGGGRIDITARALTLNGTISANGDNCSPSFCGGGSGGAVRLAITEAFAGDGVLSSIGGGGNYQTNDGGGGRIAVTGFGDNTFSGVTNAATLFFLSADNSGIFKVNGRDAELSVNVGESVDDIALAHSGQLTVNVPLTRTALDIDGSLTMNAPLTVTGDVVMTQGTSTFSDPVSVGTWTQSGGTATLNDSLTTPTWTLSGGTTTLSDAVTVTSWTQSGGSAVLSAATALAPATFAQLGGTLDNNGTLTVPTFDSATVSGGTVVNDGALIITDDTLVEVANSVTLRQHGVIRGAGRPDGTLNALTVRAGGTLNQTVQSLQGLVLTVLGAFEVEATGTIDVTGVGGLGGRVGTNTGYGGQTWAASAPYPTGSNNNGGGSYGARGDGSSVATYGDPTNPQEWGSGGNKWSSGGGSFAAGNGGGRIDITAASATLDGVLRADGDDCTTFCGGGSGGAIRVAVSGALSGAGELRAEGKGSGYNVRSGAGGRVAVTGFTSGAFTGFSEAGTVYILGADGQDGIFKVNGRDAAIEVFAGQTADDLQMINGGELTLNIPLSLPSFDVDGSLTMNAPLTVTGELVMDQGTSTFAAPVSVGTWTQTGGTATFDDTIDATTWSQSGGTTTFNDLVTIGGWTQSGGTVNLPIGLALAPSTYTQSGGSFHNDGTLTVPLFTDTTVTGGGVRNDGTLIITDDTVVHIANGVTVTQHGVIRGAGRPDGTLNALTVQAGGTVNQTVQSLQGLVLTLLGAFEIEPTGLIDVTGVGGLGGRVGTNTGYGGQSWAPSAPYPTSAGNNNAGGSYGARGGGASIQTYGSATNPQEWGTGGNKWGSGGGSFAAGNGGGRIDITAASAVLDGVMRADGNDCTTFCGGGSGGAIRVDASGAVSGTGALYADGKGSGYQVTSGGGGRIAVLAGSGTYTGTASGGSTYINGVLTEP